MTGGRPIGCSTNWIRHPLPQAVMLHEVVFKCWPNRGVLGLRAGSDDEGVGSPAPLGQ